MKIMSIDPSTHTGFCVLDLPSLDPHEPEIILEHVSVYHFEPCDDKMDRLLYGAGHLEEMLKEHEPEAVYIEGYSFASKFNHEIMYSIGTMFRLFLRQSGIPFEEVPPSSVKKFVTGKGTGKKDLMLMKVLSNWGIEIEDDNKADAFAIAMYAAFKSLYLTNEKGEISRTLVKSIPVQIKNDLKIN